MRLVNADNVKEYARNHLSNPYEIMSTCAMVNSTNTEDAKIIVHGRWIYNTDDFTPSKRCSVCGYNRPIIAGEHVNQEADYYCCRCGAEMESNLK